LTKAIRCGSLLTKMIIKTSESNGGWIHLTLEEAWAEFKSVTEGTDIHVGMLEAMQIFRSGGQAEQRQAELTPEKKERGRFLDWLLHEKQDRSLAYQYLRQVGTVTVGPRDYWATDQGGRRAIAWESSYSYPGSDSEIWDVIYVDAP
jgi:hypothetical protein